MKKDHIKNSGWYKVNLPVDLFKICFKIFINNYKYP